MSMTTQIPSYARVPRQRQSLYWNYQLRPYWADCELGVFRTTRNADRGATLQVQIYQHRFVTERRWRFEEQSWLDIAFFDADGVASAMPLKKESATNLVELFQTWETWKEEGVDPYAVDSKACMVQLTLKPRMTMDELAYFAVEVERWWTVSESRFNAANAFLGANPAALEFPSFWATQVGGLA